MRAVIIGGGLAGLTVALELRRHGVEAIVLEGSARLGGKAGSDHVNGFYEDHGYHIVPAWYKNFRGLLDELGVVLDDLDGYHFLLPKQFPTFVPISFMEPFREGVIPTPDKALCLYFVADMIGHSMSQKRYLDRLSLVGLLRSKWYATEPMSRYSQENLLKAVAVPANELSAFTTRVVGWNWFSNMTPFISVLRGPMQQTLIQPLEARIRGMGADVRIGWRVEKLVMAGGKVDGVEARTPAGTLDTVRGDVYVCCTNLEVTQKLVTDEVYEGDPALGRIHQLRAKPMTGLNIYFNKKIPGLPNDHIFLVDGRYALSMIDVSQHWPGLANTAISAIASDTLPLKGVSPAGWWTALFGEIQKYLPVTEADVEHYALHQNVDTPLFCNTIAAWPNRPSVRSAIPNLRLAGDYVQNSTDLACMEGTMASALDASDTILDDAGIAHRQMPLLPFRWPRWMFRAAEILGAPLVPPFYLWSRMGSLFRR
jgi:hypothetical protein